MENSKQFEQMDLDVGIIKLYSEEVLEKLKQCYPEWVSEPTKLELSLMINGGCTFYQYGNLPYVYGLKLKELQLQLNDTELDFYMEWFSRFADLLALTSYKQKWYLNRILQFKIQTEKYLKSIFTVLANIAFCASKYEDLETKKSLRCQFKTLLISEIERDYKEVFEEQFAMQKIIEEIHQGLQSKEPKNVEENEIS